jgi:hypothetical protein
MWIDHRGSTRFVPTDYDIAYNEWDAVGGTLVLKGSGLRRRLRLNRYARNMARDIMKIKTIVQTLENTRGVFTTADITKEI